MSVNNPCRGCDKRKAGCHTWCEDGLRADEERRMQKKKINDERNKERLATGTIINLKQAVKKRREKW